MLYPNASCRCWVIEGGADIYPVTSNVFFFRSCYNRVDTVVREITVTPLLMELNLGKRYYNQYFLVLKVSVDKVFGKKTQYSSLDFCTEFDIVNRSQPLYHPSLYRHSPILQSAVLPLLRHQLNTKNPSIRDVSSGKRTSLREIFVRLVPLGGK
mgnify:CR=1 FL=1